MRWKAFFFNNQQKDQERAETFGIKTRKCPPQVQEMISFENDLFDMIKNVKFKLVRNTFQSQLNQDLNKIRQSKNIFVFADKTRNIYELSKEAYNKLLKENITKTYKKADDNTYNEINMEAKNIASKLKIDDRVECLAKKNAFITVKDHKDNFENSPKCRLINPAKSELGVISKKITERIIMNMRDNVKFNQWNNSSNVIQWFKNIPEKHLHSFVQFDIVEFYPSISEQLLTKALNFAKTFTNVNTEDVKIIMHAKRSLLFENETTWIKKGDSSRFDVTMGSFDGAETCELVGLYILHILGQKFGTDNYGLYRDDGLAYFKNLNGNQSDRLRKDIINVFKELGLQITIQTNLKIVNFLDITFNLQDGSFKPYRKPNDKPLYININSNHPRNIIQQIPEMTSKRLSSISSNEDIFKDAAPYYENILKTSGYKENLSYQSESSKADTRKNRNRKIIWFNPPYSCNVKSNIARQFLQLVDRHFPQNNKLHKIFNRNNVKVSYSCMPNFESQIKSHNAQVLKGDRVNNEKRCNCRNKDTCPLEGNCLIDSVVYRGNVTTPDIIDENNYIGLTENHFKGRERHHYHTFQNEGKKTTTALSSYFWQLKEKGTIPKVKYSVLQKSAPYTNGSKRCALCLAEKYHVIFQPFKKLNRRSELVSKCRHENKYYLRNFIPSVR